MCGRCGGQRPRHKSYCQPCLRIVTLERKRRHDKKRRRCPNCYHTKQLHKKYCGACLHLANQISIGQEPIGAHAIHGRCHCCGAGGVTGRGRMYCADCATRLRRTQWREYAWIARRRRKRLAMRRAA